ncbi:hypothetical protein [Gracilibacillus saliphilus]|nr:hypothetical protein [Gracilibacillus saliphilus]
MERDERINRLALWVNEGNFIKVAIKKIFISIVIVIAIVSAKLEKLFK